MTRHEWNTSQDPQAMLDFLRGNATDRKLRRLWSAMEVSARFSPESFWNEQANFIWAINGELLEHLRVNGPHHRGCFALDLVLGRE